MAHAVRMPLPTALEYRGGERRLLHREGRTGQALGYFYFEDEPVDAGHDTRLTASLSSVDQDACR